MMKDLVKRIAHVEMYVANIILAVSFYQKVFGFKVVHTDKYDNADKVSVVLVQANIKLILTSSKCILGEIAEQISLYGDFVKDIALEVQNLETVYVQAIKSGFISIAPPQDIKFQGKKIRQSTIGTFGNIQHTLIEKVDIDMGDDFILPNHPLVKTENEIIEFIQDIDHIAIAVDELNKWRNLYEQGLGFYPFYQETIETKYSGMDSVVMNSQNDDVKFVFVAPKKGVHKSQIEKFLDYNNDTAGVQHLAFSTKDILDTIMQFKKNNIEFLSISDEYYNNLSSELKENFKEYIERIKDLKILVDKDDDGYLLQIFTKPLQTRPTFFCEFIQRQGATSFGKNNIMALFKAIEKQIDG